MKPRCWPAAAMAALAVALAAPAPLTAPALAQQPLAGLSAKDRQIGQQGYKEIVQQFGGKVEGPLETYVRSVALKVALASVPGSRPEDWTVTVLNSPVPNAMATPGGYLYITRGLLAMINSEAELASVLGHEAGHVAARHSDKRNSRAAIGGLATIAAAILGGSQVAQMANMGASAWVSGYSRGQEDEADNLGMRYILQAGYDPRAAASMLEALDRVAAVEGRQQVERGGLASIFSTHPVTAERVARVRRAAERTGRAGILNVRPYLAAIDGIYYGDSPDQGIVTGTSFRHASLGIGFDAPRGFTLRNTPQAVVGQAADGSNFMMVGTRLQPGQTVQQLVSDSWQQLAGSTPFQYGEQRVNGLQAAQSAARIRGQRGQVDVGIAAYRTNTDQVYLIRTVAPAGRAAAFAPLLSSFRPLTAAEKAEAGRGRRIDVVAVKPGETIASLSARMAPPYNRPESLRALNGLGDAPLAAGQEVKLIVE